MCRSDHISIVSRSVVSLRRGGWYSIGQAIVNIKLDSNLR